MSKRFWSESTDTGIYYYDENKRIFPKDFLTIMNKMHEENMGLIDEYHTMEELYEFRLIYNALLFNNWYKHNEIEVYKSKKHSDGTIPFEYDDDEWFIVVALLPTGQITNHYSMDYWDYFKIPSYPKVKDEYDGHSSSDVLFRLEKYLMEE